MKTTSKNEDNLKNEDDHNNEEYLKIEDDIKKFKWTSPIRTRKNKENLHNAGRHIALDIFSFAAFSLLTKQ